MGIPPLLVFGMSLYHSDPIHALLTKRIIRLYS